MAKELKKLKEELADDIEHSTEQAMSKLIHCEVSFPMNGTLYYPLWDSIFYGVTVPIRNSVMEKIKNV